MAICLNFMFSQTKPMLMSGMCLCESLGMGRDRGEEEEDEVRGITFQPNRRGNTLSIHQGRSRRRGGGISVAVGPRQHDGLKSIVTA